MDATTMRSVLAYLAELRRDREYHRAIEHATINPKEDAVHNRHQRNGSGDVGCDQDSVGQSGYHL